MPRRRLGCSGVRMALATRASADVGDGIGDDVHHEFVYPRWVAIAERWLGEPVDRVFARWRPYCDAHARRCAVIDVCREEPARLRSGAVHDDHPARWRRRN